MHEAIAAGITTVHTPITQYFFAIIVAQLGTDGNQRMVLTAVLEIRWKCWDFRGRSLAQPCRIGILSGDRRCQGPGEGGRAQQRGWHHPGAAPTEDLPLPPRDRTPGCKDPAETPLGWAAQEPGL